MALLHKSAKFGDKCCEAINSRACCWGIAFFGMCPISCGGSYAFFVCMSRFFSLEVVVVVCCLYWHQLAVFLSLLAECVSTELQRLLCGSAEWWCSLQN